MSSPKVDANQTWDESHISQIRECLATFTESIGSPGQQDASMDNSYTMGFRSPSMNTLAGQPTSPGPGRSLREHEEQMSALRKENFNLKLRIYFLEENAGIKAGTAGNISGGSGGNNTGIGHGSPTDGTVAQENLFKQNIDLKVEVESLRKDLQEKQDLLYQAAKAMEMMEEGQRKVEQHHQEVVSDMEHRIEMLQQEIKLVKAADHQHQQHGNQTRTAFNDTNLLDFLEKMEHREVNMMDKVQVMELENAIRQLRDQNDDLSHRIVDLHTQLEEKEQKINSLEAELGEMRFECSEMKDKLEKNDRSSMDAEQMSTFLKNAMETKEERLMHLNLEIKVLKLSKDLLTERNRRLEKENRKQLQIINDQKRLDREMSEIISVKNSPQVVCNQNFSKFREERHKLMAEIEQLKVRDSSGHSKIRPKSTPASEFGLKFSTRQKLQLNSFPLPKSTQGKPPGYEYWSLKLSKSQTFVGTRHSSSPLNMNKSNIPHFDRKKSGSESKISVLVKKTGPSSSGYSSFKG